MRIALIPLGLILSATFCSGQLFPGSSGTGGLMIAHFASPPASPTLNQAFLFVDATSSGTCGGGGTAYAVCAWNGSAFTATAGTSTGLGDPGANGIVYRSGAGTSTDATATQMSGPNFCADAGSTSAYACNLSPAIGSYVTGTLYWFKANTAYTIGTPSINYNSKGALTIVKMIGGITTSLSSGDIAAGQWVAGVYDGTNFQMASQLGTAVDTGSIQTLTNKTLDGVSPTTMSYLDATSSVQTQLNAKLSSPVALTSLATQAANTILANCTGSTAAPAAFTFSGCGIAPAISSPTANAVLIDNGSGVPADANFPYTSIPLLDSNSDLSLPIGTCANPGVYLGADSATGWIRNAVNQWTWCQGNSSVLSIIQSLLRFYNNYTVCWSSSGSSQGGCDTGISRDSSGIIDCGNGTQGNKSCTFNAAVLNAAPTATTNTGTSGTAVCSQSLQGTLKTVTCYFNGYANTSTVQEYAFPVAFSTTPILQISGGSLGIYNPSVSSTTLTLPANASMTAETGTVVVIGQ